jgi:hypothetical protein
MWVLYKTTLTALIIVIVTANCAIASSPTPPTTPTGIPYVDTVIDAVQSGDLQAFKSLLVYMLSTGRGPTRTRTSSSLQGNSP